MLDFPHQKMRESAYPKKVGERVGLSVTEEGGESAVDPR